MAATAVNPYAGSTMEARPGVSLDQAREAFRRAGLEEPETEAARLLAILSAEPAHASYIDLEAIARDRARGVPLEYAAGRGRFMARSFLCTAAALIPRAETELLARVALALASPGETIVDIGTGSGNLAITLALDVPESRVYACDISEEAIDLARANVERHHVQDRVIPRIGDLFAALDGSARGSRSATQAERGRYCRPSDRGAAGTGSDTSALKPAGRCPGSGRPGRTSRRS